MTLSVCLIVKNEQEVLERCLSCVKRFADEIVIVDTGSTDDTLQIAKKFTNNVYNFKWEYDFSAARNFCFSKATCDLVMWLDADDIVLDEDIEKINNLKKVEKPADMYMFEYVLSHESDMTPIFSYARERVFLRSGNYKWVDAIHEVIIPSGRVEHVDIKIYHEKIKPTPKGRNLKIYHKLKQKKVVFSPRQQFYYARELMFNGYYKKAISELKKFLRMPDGWVENKIQACIDISICMNNLGEFEKACQALLQSFLLAPPRGEAACRLGDNFLRQKKYDDAIFWYKQALSIQPNLNSGAFVEKDMYDFIPALQLCYVYYLKGDLENSYKFHLVSQKLKPSHPSVLHNQNFFDNCFEKSRK